MHHFLRHSVLCLLALLALNAYAQDEAAEPAAEEVKEAVPAWQPQRLQSGRVISVGDYSIENPLVFMRGAKNLKLTQEGHFRHFMHGRTDSKAMPIAWQALDGSPEFTALLDYQSTIRIPVKGSTLPAVVLGQGKEVTPANSLLTADELYANRGGFIRFYIWMRGDSTGDGSDLWSGAPQVKLQLYSANGFKMDEQACLFRTRGTFPWFCYHLDMLIPRNFQKPAEKAAATEGTEAEAAPEGTENTTAETEGAAKETPPAADSIITAATMLDSDDDQEDRRPCGLYITLSNPSSGHAWFSTLSWEPIPLSETMLNSKAADSRTDPATGSMAPNPDYDELPMHLIYGVSDTCHWNFLKGNKAFKDLTKIENLKGYIADNRDDWFHALHAFPYLVSIYNNGLLLKTAPAFQEGWLNELANQLERLQFDKTALWGAGNFQNLFITEKILSNCYNPAGIPRKDFTPRATPWLSIPGKPLKNADAIIDTVLAARQMDNGKPAAWNNFTFQELLKDSDDYASPCDIEATAAAARILRLASLSASPEKAKAAQNAIAQAWKFVRDKLLFKNGLWKKGALDGTLTSDGNLYSLLDAAMLLEPHPLPGALPPKVESTLDKQKLTLSWQDSAGYVSLRVYLAPAGVGTDALTDKDIVAIIQPRQDNIRFRDPLVLARDLINAGNRQWGVAPMDLGADYLAYKYAALSPKTKLSAKVHNFKVALPQSDKDQSVHLVAITEDGARSPWITLPESIPGTASDGEKTANGEQPAENATETTPAEAAAPAEAAPAP